MNNMRGGAFDCEEQDTTGPGLLHYIDLVDLWHRRLSYHAFAILPNGVRLVLEEDRARE